MADPNKIREEVKALTERLEAGVQDIYASDKYRAYLDTLSKFHSYSTRNTILIHLQNPGATRVAGFHKWISDFERRVMKGEKGIRIFAPSPYTIKKTMQKLDPNTQAPVLGADGQPVTEEVEQTIPAFKAVSVFDVSQTDGKPLPSLAENLTGDVRQYEAFMDALKAVSAMPIKFEPLDPDTDGVCRHDAREIAIREGMSEVQTVSAAIHEMTHADLHDYNESLAAREQRADAAQGEATQGGEKPAPKRSRRAEEVEAESVSYVVCQHYGIETGANSFGYIADWSKGRELDELKASLEIIRKAATDLIGRVDAKFNEICKERGIDLTAQQPAAGREQAPAASRYTVEPMDGDFFIRDTATGNFHGENGLVLRYTDRAAVEEVAGELNRNLPEPEQAATPGIDADALIAGYARSAEMSAPRRPGAGALMTPVFIDGNFNRAGTKIHVTAEERAGKYELFSHEKDGYKTLYFLTVSGMVDRTSEYYPDEWDSRNHRYIPHIPTETELDEAVRQIAARFDRDMADPAKWAKYQHAAVVNRLDECDAHNAPIRELRERESAERMAAAEQERREQEQKELAAYDSRVDEIAKAVEQGTVIRVAHDAGEFGGKNPVLDLFKLYGIEIPLRTQGWVNTGLAEITEDSYRYFSRRSKGNSSVFRDCLDKLRGAIRETPIEQKRASLAPEPEPAAEAEQPEEPAAREAEQDLPPPDPPAQAAPAPTVKRQYYMTERQHEQAERMAAKWEARSEAFYLGGDDWGADVKGYCKSPEDASKATAQAHRIRAAISNLLGGAGKWMDVQVIREAVADRDGLDAAITMNRDLQGQAATQAGEPALEQQPPAPEEPATGVPENPSPTADADKFLEDIGGIENLFGKPTPPPKPARAPKPPKPARAPKPPKEYDINYGYMGNGLTVWNRLEEKYGDYVVVAHISPEREVKFYEDMPDEIKAQIETIARTSDERISVMRDDPVFRTPPQTAEPERDPIDQFAADYGQCILDAYRHGKLRGSREEFEKDIAGIADSIRAGDVNGIREALDRIAYAPATKDSPAAVKAAALMERLDKIAPQEPPAREPEEPPADAPDLLSPDQYITAADRDSYGYTKPDMLPLRQARAIELFELDYSVYMLHPGDREEMVFEPSDIIRHNGLFGIDAEEWRASPEFQAAQARMEQEAPPPEVVGNYSIYQIKGGEELRDYRFESLETLEKRGLAVDKANYELVYTAPLTGSDTLEDIYIKFNVEHPADFRGHSMSMSDVVMLERGGAVTFHYCDETAFQTLPAFTEIERQPEVIPQESAPPAYTGPSVAELEVQAHSGQPISLLGLANAVNAERQAPAPGKRPGRGQTVQKSSPKTGKPSLIARLQAATKEAAAGREQGKNEPKHDNNREV